VRLLGRFSDHAKARAATLSRDSSGEVPMFEPADGGWVVE
jgi:hypothetical protein